MSALSLALRQVLDWSAAMVRAVSFLHSRDVVHRDLKPLNLLLTKHLELKVSDFGISRMMARCDGDSGYTMTGGVGSWRYMAPEVVRHQVYDEKVPSPPPSHPLFPPVVLSRAPVSCS